MFNVRTSISSGKISFSAQFSIPRSSLNSPHFPSVFSFHIAYFLDREFNYVNTVFISVMFLISRFHARSVQALLPCSHDTSVCPSIATWFTRHLYLSRYCYLVHMTPLSAHVPGSRHLCLSRYCWLVHTIPLSARVLLPGPRHLFLSRYCWLVHTIPLSARVLLPGSHDTYVSVAVAVHTLPLHDSADQPRLLRTSRYKRTGRRRHGNVGMCEHHTNLRLVSS